MNRILKLGLPALLFLIPSLSQAGIIFTNFGPSLAYNLAQGNFSGNGQDGSGSAYAEGDTFTPTSTARFSGLTIALSCFSSGLCPVGFTVSLAQDNGDQPGAALETFSVLGASVGPFGASNPPLVLTSVLNPVLTLNTQYWVTVSAPLRDSVIWNANSTGDLSDEAISTDQGATWFSPSGLTPGAYEVDSVVVGTPEPGTAFLLVGAIALVLSTPQKSRRR